MDNICNNIWSYSGNFEFQPDFVERISERLDGELQHNDQPKTRCEDQVGTAT